MSNWTEGVGQFILGSLNRSPLEKAAVPLLEVKVEEIRQETRATKAATDNVVLDTAVRVRGLLEEELTGGNRSKCVTALEDCYAGYLASCAKMPEK